jgi:predicted dithiol-disulfide oxidoreductase (DUF899 family)
MNASPPIVTAEEWQRERDALLVQEKELTRALDALAARRRRLPMVRFNNDKYIFATSDGPRRLSDFFEGRPQLAVYQFMDRGPETFCGGCTNLTNQVTALADLAETGLSWRTISNMPLPQMEGYWAKKGWSVPFASSHGTEFTADTGAGESFLFNIFFTDGTDIFRTYSTTARGLDRVMFAYNILDLAPYGRQEDWEDSPDGWPQNPTYG